MKRSRSPYHGHRFRPEIIGYPVPSSAPAARGFKCDPHQVRLVRFAALNSCSRTLVNHARHSRDACWCIRVELWASAIIRSVQWFQTKTCGIRIMADNGEHQWAADVSAFRMATTRSGGLLPWTWEPWGRFTRQRLFQGRILFAGCDQGGNIGIGVLPHCKEILVGFLSRGSVTRKCLRARATQISH